MRIVGGEFRGIRINIPSNFRARPTTDMAKESLFNILNNKIDLDQIEVLDLFSGTGGISFEFASRGCKSCVLVEKNYVHYKHILKNVEKLNLKEIIQPIKSDAFHYLSSCKKKFDVVFADPPYDLKNLNEIPEKIIKADILNKDGLIIIEHPGNYNFNEIAGFMDMRAYGSVHFSFFKNI